MHAGRLDLSAEQFAALRALLDTALDLPADTRAAWLDGLGAEHAALVPRLRALLANADDPRLDTLPRIETGDFAPPLAQPADPSGMQVGPYRLLGQIGEGGMAAVWLAERTDLLQRRQVALKLPHGAWRRAGLAERFAREREILATLAHPHIARLYDAGIAEDGQPWLALEYVEGQRIDRYCADEALPVPARLRLMLQVMDAVAHAHAKLVVHRDLKPANILVTADGQVRLLDFGIAKLLDHEVAEETALTRESGRVMTPDYAAPEQIRGEAASTAVDIHALGAVLFELLTGQRPFARSTRTAVEEAILTTEAPAPSSVVADRALRKALRGDLDTIVRKALRKNPAERYATVHAFAEDLANHLAHRPVRARPASAWYRLRSFVARNRLAVGTTAGTGLALAVAAGVALNQAQVATREQARAERVKDFVTSLLADADPYAVRARGATVRDLLQRAHRRLTGELADQPAVRAELLRLVGRAMANQYDLASADDVLVQAVDATRQLQDTPATQLALADAQVALGEVRKESGRLEEAKSLLTQAMEHLVHNGRHDSDTFIDARLLQAGIALSEGDYAAMTQAAQDAIAIATRLHGEGDVRVAEGFALLSKVRGTTPQDQARALDAARRAFEILERAVGRQDPPHPDFVDAVHDYGVALLGVGELGAAQAHVDRSLELARRLYGPDGVVPGHYEARLAQIRMLRGELDAGIAQMRAALERLARIDPKPTVAKAGRLRSLALGLIARHRAAQAPTALDNAIAILSSTKDRRTLLIARADLGMAYLESGRAQQARALLADVDREGRLLVPPERPLRALGRMARLQGQHGDARTLLDTALGLAQRDPRHFFLADVAIDLAQAELDGGDLDAATRDVQAAHAELDRISVDDTPARAAALSVAGAIALARGSAAQALPLLERADAIWRRFEIADRWSGETASTLAHCLVALGRRADALAAATRASRDLAGSPHAVDAALRAGLPRAGGRSP